MAAPSASMLPDTDIDQHPQQLYEAIRESRRGLLEGARAAAAKTKEALGALTGSRCALSDARTELVAADASRTISSYLVRRLSDAKLSAESGVGRTENSARLGNATITAVNAAALDIKAAATALDVVARHISGIYGVTKANGREPADKTNEASSVAAVELASTRPRRGEDGGSDDAIDRAAAAAYDAVHEAGKVVENLKDLAMEANVQAIASLAATAQHATRQAADGIGGVLGIVEGELLAARNRIAAARKARIAELANVRRHTFDAFRFAREANTTDEVVVDLDRVSNASLRVRLKNTAPVPSEPGVAPDEGAGLEAACDFVMPGWALAATAAVRFFAVPVADLEVFTLAEARVAGADDCRSVAAVLGPGEPMTEGDAAAEKGEAIASLGCTAFLRRDTAGRRLRFGEAYHIFFLRIPRGSLAGVADFSFASLPVVCTIELSFTTAPQVFLLPRGALVVGFEGADPRGDIDGYELFFCSSESSAEFKGDDLPLTALFTLACATSFDRQANACIDPDAAVAALERVGNDQPDTRGADYFLDRTAGLERMRRWLEEKSAAPEPRPVYLAYFAPYVGRTGWQESGGYQVGRYLEMFGARLDLSGRRYHAVVLAKGARGLGALPKAPPVLSPFSDGFGAAPAEKRPRP